MLIFGVGLGGVMQVLVIAVQNAVDYEDLGAATSGATFFRQIGGSFGTAVFGAIFANVLTGKLAHDLSGVKLPGGTAGSSGISPGALATLPSPVHAAYVHAYAGSLQVVFITAVPVAAFAFLLTWLLPEVELRATAAAADHGQTFAMSQDRTSLEEVTRAVSVLASREQRREVYERLAKRACLTLQPRACWLLFRIDEHRGLTAEELAERLDVPAAGLAALAAQLTDEGLICADGEVGHPSSEQIVLTAAGRAAVDQLIAARRDALAELLEGWRPSEHPELERRLHELARSLLIDDRRLLEAAQPTQPC